MERRWQFHSQDWKTIGKTPHLQTLRHSEEASEETGTRFSWKKSQLAADNVQWRSVGLPKCCKDKTGFLGCCRTEVSCNIRKSCWSDVHSHHKQTQSHQQRASCSNLMFSFHWHHFRAQHGAPKAVQSRAEHFRKHSRGGGWEGRS